MAERSFLRRMSALSLREGEELKVELLLLCVGRIWAGHLPRRGTRLVHPGREPRSDLGHVGEIISLEWPGNALGFPQWR